MRKQRGYFLILALTHWDGSVWTTSAVAQVVNGLSFIPPKIKKTTGWQQVFH